MIGVVVLSKLGVGQFDEDDVRLLEVLAGHASVALENARLYEAQRREAEGAKESAEIANALLQLSRQLAAAEDLDSVLERLVAQTTKILGSSRTSFWLQEPRAATSRREPSGATTARQGADRAAPDFGRRRRWLRPARERPSRSAQTRPPASPARTPSPGRALRRRADPARRRPQGIPGRGREGRAEAAVSERTMRLLDGIAHQAKLAIANAMNYESLEQTFLSTVEALANALEARDEYTSSHTRAITDMALRGARSSGSTRPALKRLELGALFHDIGKIGIPSEILLKPGR